MTQYIIQKLLFSFLTVFCLRIHVINYFHQWCFTFSYFRFTINSIFILGVEEFLPDHFLWRLAQGGLYPNPETAVLEAVAYEIYFVSPIFKFQINEFSSGLYARMNFCFWTKECKLFFFKVFCRWKLIYIFKTRV